MFENKKGHYSAISVPKYVCCTTAPLLEGILACCLLMYACLTVLYHCTVLVD